MITAEAKKKYLKSAGQHCPYCESNDISGGSFESDSMEAWSEITCNDCKKRWHDVYTLTSVETILS